jgi:hypothetical protein
MLTRFEITFKETSLGEPRVLFVMAVSPLEAKLTIWDSYPFAKILKTRVAPDTWSPKVAPGYFRMDNVVYPDKWFNPHKAVAKPEDDGSKGA